MEQELFCDVQPSEFLKECWQGANREILSPRLSTLVKRFNDVSFYIFKVIVETINILIIFFYKFKCKLLGCNSSSFQPFAQAPSYDH